MTNWRKLDAALAGALGSRRSSSGEDRPLTVFVHYEGAEIATATLSADEIGALSERPDVRQIRLSSPLRLLDDQ